jgi:hypothetical protein
MREFRHGLLASLPLAPGVAVFGLLYGVLARQAGLTPFQAWGMSMMVFAELQFVAVGRTTAPRCRSSSRRWWSTCGPAAGSSIGPYLAGLPRRWKRAAFG